MHSGSPAQQDTASVTAAQPAIAIANTLFVRSERSIVVSGSLVGPGALAIICQVQGFQTWEAMDIYQLDYWAMFDALNGKVRDIEIAISGVSYFRLPVPATMNVACSGTLYLAPNSADIELRSVAGSAATYLGSLTLTRQRQGFRRE